MQRLPSLSLAPAETRGTLRDRFARFFGSASSSRVIRGDDAVLDDRSFLRLLLDLRVDYASEFGVAEETYETASRGIGHPNIRVLIDQGWLRLVWGRLSAPREIAQALDPDGRSAGLGAFMAERFRRTFSLSAETFEDPALAELARAMVDGSRLPQGTTCLTPGWVAARLWDETVGLHSEPIAALRVWSDRWNIMHEPELVPDQVWTEADAETFRSAVLSVLETDAGLPNWTDFRELLLTRAALASRRTRAEFEQDLPPVPSTVVGRALWLLSRPLERALMDNMHADEEVASLMLPLLADIEAREHSRAPNPLASRLASIVVERPELLYRLLISVRSRPVLLADLLLMPETAVLSCLIVAMWEGPHGSWDREIRTRGFRQAKADAFADAATVMAHFLREGSVSPAEVAAFMKWLHSDQVGNDDAAAEAIRSMQATMQGMLIGQETDVLSAIAAALVPLGPTLALKSPAFTAALEIIDAGNLAAGLDPGPYIAAYVDGIAAGGLDASVKHITRSGAASLHALASQATSGERKRFLFPLDVEVWLCAGTETNPYTLADGIARSIRAHIRVLCRIVVGLGDAPSKEMTDALVAALHAGARDDRAQSQVAAFAPRLESTFGFRAEDRPIAADIGEALSALRGGDLTKVLAGLLETNEPLILAQIMPLAPKSVRDTIAKRIAEIAPAEATEIHSLTEAEARVDQLLSAGLPDSASRFMEHERTLGTLGKIPGRSLRQLRASLRLKLLRGDWQGLDQAEVPPELSRHDRDQAADAVAFFQAVSQLKKPDGNLEGAKATFGRLASRRASVPAYAVNLLATRIALLLRGTGFSTLAGEALAEGRRLLADAEALARADPEVTDTIKVNKALLLLVVGRFPEALTVLSTIRREELRPVVAAYSAVALAATGLVEEASATLASAESAFGPTEVVSAARDYLVTGERLPIRVTPSLEDDPLPRLKMAMLDFQQMDHERQARVMSSEANPFLALATSHVRSATETIVGLVPMMKNLQIDASEDDLTAHIQHQLAARVAFLGWTVTDQSRGGFTAKGNPGERDLLLRKGTTTLAVIEAVVLRRPVNHEWSRAELTSHLQKLLGYSTCALFFHLTYAYTGDLKSIFEHLRATAAKDAPPGFTYLDHDDIPLTDARPTGFVARYRGSSAT